MSATITSKGQVTIPKEIRNYLKLDIGSKVEFVVDENGNLKVIALNFPVSASSGILHRQGMKAVSIEEMAEAIAEAAHNWT